MKFLSRASAALCMQLAAFLFAQTAFAQGTVLQSGPVTGGHVPMYMSGFSGNSQAILMDSGPASGGANGLGLSESLLQARSTPPGSGPDGTHNCNYSTYSSNPAGGYFLCFDAAALGGGLIDFGSFGPVSLAPLNIKVNGAVYPFPQPAPPASGINVTSAPYNAKCDGSTDDSAAFTAAIAAAAASGQQIVVPSRVCFTATPQNAGSVPVVGAGPIVPALTPTGPTIMCPASVTAPCLVSGTVSNTQNIGGVLQNLIVTYSGTPVSGDSGIQIQGYNSWQSEVMVINSYDGFTWFRGSFSKQSIASHSTDIYTCKILHNHLVVNGVPEVYLFGGRIGCNGESTTGTNAYVAFSGQDPNGFTAIGVHFNQGVVGVAHFLDFDGLTSQVNGEYRFVGVHVEGLIATGSGGSVYYSGDQSGTCLKCSTDNTSVFNDTSTTFQSGIGAMTNSIFAGNYFISDLTLDSSVQYTSVNFNNINAFSGPGTSVTITGASGSDMIVHDIRTNGTFTVSGGPWFSLRLSNVLPANYHDTAATGTIYASGVPTQSFTPTVLFNGTTPPTGWSFSTVGSFTRLSDGSVQATAGFAATGAGSTSGALVSLGGFPYTCVSLGINNPGRSTASAGFMTGITPPVTMTLNQSTSNILLGQWSNTGIANLLDTNLTSTSVVSGQTSCMPQ